MIAWSSGKSLLTTLVYLFSCIISGSYNFVTKTVFIDAFNF